MKIKTITCHEVYNYGASLQAYALMKYMQDLGHDVEIIDYKPEFLTRRYYLWAISPRWDQNLLMRLIYYSIKVPGKYFRFLNEKKPFDRFTKKYLKLTDKTYHTNDELKSDCPDADIYLAGSDQIWNSISPNGKDPAFYLDFAKRGTVKASYAASFGTDYIAEGYEDQVKKWISNLDYVSVRESTGLKILDSLGIQGEQVLDPVFLLSSLEWSKLVKGNMMKNKYILVYDFENNAEIEHFSRKIAAETGYPIISINNYVKQSYSKKHINNVSPLEYIGLIRNSEVFISNSFHGTAFSIIFNKDFYIFNRIYQKVNSRMVDLLGLLGIENRIVSGENKFNIGNEIDYDKVNVLLDKKISLSKKYLDRVCNQAH